MSEYDTANEHELCFQIGKLKRRIAELSRALGLITTLKPTMVMDADHPLDMAKEVVEYMTTIIANTQQANRGLCANYIYELNENIKLTARIAKLEAENERLKEDLQHEKTRSRLNLEAEKRRMLNITYYCAEIDRLNARIAELKDFIDKLIEAGNAENRLQNFEVWQALVEERKVPAGREE